jgi:hypothetical protein
MRAPTLKDLPEIKWLEGIGIEGGRWVFSFETLGGLSIMIEFNHDDALLMIHYLEEARKTRGWPLPERFEARKGRVDRQPPIRVTKMGGVYLGTDDEFASIQFESGEDEVFDMTLPKGQVVRLLSVATVILRVQGWGTYAERCFFHEGRERCRATQKSGRKFCDTHDEIFSGRSNKEIIEQAAEHLSHMISRQGAGYTFQGDIDAETMGSFASLLSELGSRGYIQDDVAKAIRAIAEEKKIIESLAKRSSDPKWKRFEKLAFGVHLLREDGAQVSYNQTIVGLRTGRPRQVDICVRYERVGQQHFVMVECKDEEVSISQVEGFNTKKMDVGADHVVVVSARGFQEGAMAAARAYDIDVFHLSEESVGWTESIRTHVHEIPWPRSIDFDMPPAKLQEKTPSFAVRLTATPFVNDLQHTSTNLATIVRDVCLWAHQVKLPLPCIVDARFDEGMAFRPPNSSVFIPVYGLKLTLDRYEVEMRQALDFPPHTVRYRFSDEKSGAVESIDPIEVNKALHKRRQDIE